MPSRPCFSSPLCIFRRPLPALYHVPCTMYHRHVCTQFSLGPVGRYPLCAGSCALSVRMLAEHMTSDSHSQSTKVWQSWLGSHTFCCDGRSLARQLKPATTPKGACCAHPRAGTARRLMFGPDIGVTLFAALLTLSISVVFWVWVCPSLHVLATVGGVALYVVNALFMAVLIMTLTQT